MHCFRAMGTEVCVGVLGVSAGEEERLTLRVAGLFARFEQLASRFRSTSELSRLNRASGPTVVSEELFALLERARAHVARTGGLFDPGVGAALEACGYDRSFAPGRLDRERVGAPPQRASLLEVGLDRSTRTVWRPAHVRIDLGGIAKGHAADLAGRLLPGEAIVDAGGDLVLRGQGPEGGGWRVEIEDPRDPEATLVTLRLGACAVATSAPNRRRWRLGRVQAHHLIDPRTARPASSDLAQVTVVAATAELAEVLAKAAFLRGRRGAAAFLRRHHVAGVLVHEAGGFDVVGELDVGRPPVHAHA